MYDERNNSMNDPTPNNSTPENSVPQGNPQETNTPENQPYHWNTPAPENGAYHGSGSGQKETFPTHSAQNAETTASNTQDTQNPQSSQSTWQGSANTQPQQNTAQGTQGAPYGSGAFHTQPQQGTPIYDRPHKRFGSGFRSGANNGAGPKQPGGKGKWAALLIVCAIGGGLIGGIFGSGIGSSLFRPSTSVQVSNRTVSDVKEVKVDGKTEMSNVWRFGTDSSKF